MAFQSTSEQWANERKRKHPSCTQSPHLLCMGKRVTIRYNTTPVPSIGKIWCIYFLVLIIRERNSYQETLIVKIPFIHIFNVTCIFIRNSFFYTLYLNTEDEITFWFYIIKYSYLVFIIFAFFFLYKRPKISQELLTACTINLSWGGDEHERIEEVGALNGQGHATTIWLWWCKT